MLAIRAAKASAPGEMSARPEIGRVCHSRRVRSAPHLAEKAATLLGLGVVVAAADFCTGVGWLLIAIAPNDDGVLWVICAAQLVYGLGFGATGPLSGSYRNAVTPSELSGRMNTTIRSFNWGLMAIAAPLGGWLAFSFGNRAALGIGGGIILLSAAALAMSRFRTAVMPDVETPPNAA